MARDMARDGANNSAYQGNINHQILAQPGWLAEGRFGGNEIHKIELIGAKLKYNAHPFRTGGPSLKRAIYQKGIGGYTSVER